MNNVKKAAALLLALALIFALPVTASAAETTEARVPVTLTVVNTVSPISCTVPACLPVSLVDGYVVCANNVAITNTGKIGAIKVTKVHGFCTAAPDKQSALDGHVVQHDFAVRCAAADDEVAVHGHVLERHFVGTNQYAALDVLVITALYRDIAANDVRKNLRKFRSRDIV